nr:MAG TPA: hypothetical protein [Caudoviricetes sp.]
MPFWVAVLPQLSSQVSLVLSSTKRRKITDWKLAYAFFCMTASST